MRQSEGMTDFVSAKSQFDIDDLMHEYHAARGYLAEPFIEDKDYEMHPLSVDKGGI